MVTTAQYMCFLYLKMWNLTGHRFSKISCGRWFQSLDPWPQNKRWVTCTETVWHTERMSPSQRDTTSAQSDTATQASFIQNRPFVVDNDSTYFIPVGNADCTMLQAPCCSSWAQWATRGNEYWEDVPRMICMGRCRLLFKERVQGNDEKMIFSYLCWAFLAVRVCFSVSRAIEVNRIQTSVWDRGWKEELQHWAVWGKWCFLSFQVIKNPNISIICLLFPDVLSVLHLW